MRPSLLVSTALVVLCQAVACQSDKDDSGPGGETAGDTSAETGTDTSADTSDTAGSASPCPAYAGVGPVGSVHAYQVPAAYAAANAYAGTWSSTIVDIDGGDVQSTTDSVYTGEGYTTTSHQTDWIHCDAEGVHPVRSLYEGSTDYGSSVQDSLSDIVYTEGALPLSLPPGIEVGSTWIIHYTGERSDGTRTTPFDYTVSSEVTREDSVTVPAGTYTAIELAQTVSGSTSTGRFDATVGWVQAEFAELVSYTP